MKRLISAAFVSALYAGAYDPAASAPAEIVYLPEGVNEITPSVNGKPQKITVRVPAEKGAAIAASLQESLTKRLAQNVRPHVAFDHSTTGAAAGIPTGFRYEPGTGVMLALDWTNSGSTAVAGRDFSYFSPCFLIDDDGFPAALPSRGEVGSLVNNPAFPNIPRIAASDASDSPTDKPKMKLVLAALKIDPAHADAEAVAADRVTALVTAAAAQASVITAKDQEIADLKTKVAAAEAADKVRRTKDGEALYKRAVACGYAAPLDDAKKLKIIKASEEGNEIAIEFLTEQIEAAEAAGDIADPTKKIVAAGGGGKVGGNDFLSKANALVSAKQAADLPEAYQKVAASNPELWEAYEASLKA